VRFYDELRRRNVFRVGAAYAVVGWLLIEVSDTVFPRLALPDWTVTLVIMLVLLGFPLALLLAWAFELTPQGIRRTEAVSGSEDVSRADGRGLDLLLVAVLGLAIAVYVGNWLIGRGTAPDSPAPAVEAGDTTAPVEPSVLASGPKSVAVLPFEDLSPAGDQGWFADGLTREILHGLTQLPELRVIARHSSFQFRERPADIGEAGRILGVQHLVEGWVRASGNALQVTAQLVRIADGSIVWSERYDRNLDDVLLVQQEIARSVGRMLEVYLDEPRLQAMFATGTRHPEAFLHYLRGRSLFDQAHLQGIAASPLLWEANDWFTRALAIDAGYAPARFYRMDAYSHVLQHDLAAPPDLRTAAGEPDFELAYARLHEDLERAAESAGETSFGKVIALVRYFLLGEWERLPSLIDGLEERTVIEASELISGGFFYYAPLILGKHEDAARVWRVLGEHDPLAAFPWRALVGTALASGRPEEALRLAGEARSRGLDHVGIFESQVFALVLLEQPDEAMALIEERASRGRVASGWWLEGLVHAQRGNFREVEMLLAESSEPDPRSDRRCWLLARIGRQAEANACAAAIDAEPLGAVRLAKAVVDGGSIPFDPEAAPRFSALLERTGTAHWRRTTPVGASPAVAAPAPGAGR
jgi:adenylate cyclase